MKKINLTKWASRGAALAMLLPSLVLAADINTLINNVKTTLNYVIGLLFVLVTVYFIWGIIKYISAAGDEEKLTAGKRHMIYGIIGMAIMAAAWGIVNILVDYIGGGTTPNVVKPPSFN
ncbi:MAG: hypothetical protein UU87_C0001G0058 [Parcubacteria group bacterium GW2011_GWA2_42_11]|nr:MAG: hypothetical protein UU87_C0001G0058 [Parcubacteria group bacterium GW2011_GWA2_42_11]